MYTDIQVRSIVKAISWRILGSLATSALVYIFTGKGAIALMLGGVEFVVKVGIYFVHERLWDRVPFGRRQLKPTVIWLTGLPCSGKTTLSLRVLEVLQARGLRVEHLDGDSIRKLYPNVGFSRKERDDHIQRIGFLANRLEVHGVSVVASFVSPYRDSRDFVRKLCNNFLEIYVSTPAEECERRDVKGLYVRARNGELNNFTGVNDPYEAPLTPDLAIDTTNIPVEQAVTQIVALIDSRKGAVK